MDRFAEMGAIFHSENVDFSSIFLPARIRTEWSYVNQSVGKNGTATNFDMAVQSLAFRGKNFHLLIELACFSSARGGGWWLPFISWRDRFGVALGKIDIPIFTAHTLSLFLFHVWFSGEAFSFLSFDVVTWLSIRLKIHTLQRRFLPSCFCFKYSQRTISSALRVWLA